MDQEPLRWGTYEYIHREKGPDWFWAVGIVAVAFAVTAIILNNVLFGILILLATFTLLIYAARHPEIIGVEINHRGIIIDQYFHPYTTLDSFWVEEHVHHPKILIKSKKLLMPYIIVHIEDMHPDEIREYLGQYLVEEEHTEPFLQKLMEHVGF